jgi:hypothetical protein
MHLEHHTVCVLQSTSVYYSSTILYYHYVVCIDCIVAQTPLHAPPTPYGMYTTKYHYHCM